MLATLTVAANETTGPTNCYPFGGGSSTGPTNWLPYAGFVYRDVPTFSAQPGDKLAFDMGQVNNSDIQFEIALAATTVNGGNVNDGAFVTVVSNTQTAATPRGDTIIGNYELEYTFESPFAFAGGGLIIRFSNPSPSYSADSSCNQMMIGGTSSDSSGQFVQRFFRDQDGVAPWNVGAGAPIANFRVTTIGNTPPVLSDVGLSSTSISEGDSTSLMGTISDAQGGPFTLEVDWGDGNQETIVLPANTTTFSVPHLYVDDDPSGTSSDVYEVQILSLTDPEGSEAIGGGVGLQRVMTFDEGSSPTAQSYTEVGMTLSVLEPNDHFHIANFGGDSSRDALAHTVSASPLRFELAGGGTFTLERFDVVLVDGPATFTSSSGASVTISTTGSVTFPASGWANIDYFDWTALSAGLGIDNVVFRTGSGSTLELITNGGFESGSFAGWTIANSGSGNWVINNGSFDPAGPGVPTAPINGNFDALTVQGGPGLHILSEPLLIPSSVSSATLSWSDRIRNHAQRFVDPSQEFRVEFVSVTGQVLHEVYSTELGDSPFQPGPNNRSFDVTSVLQGLAGQAVHLRFAEQDQFGFFNVNVDDISLTVEQGAPIEPLEVTVHNESPNASIDGPTNVEEGTAVTFTGSFTDVGLDDGHSQVWSVTASNGQVVPGQTVNPTAAGDSDGAGGTTFGFTPDDNGVYVVTYTVTDDDGGSRTATTTLVVDNDAPDITLSETDSGCCGGSAEDETVTLSLAFDDSGTADTHEIVIDWGDGMSDTVELTGGERSLDVTHSYDVGGVYDISVTVTDDDGDSDSAAATAVVSGVGVVGDTLYVVGTDADDHVSINQTGNGTIKVHADFLPHSNNPRDIPAAGVAQIVIILCDGDDHATISNKVTLPALIDGGAGNDHLNAGGGGSILLGGAGDDMLIGGSGRDVLIGGSGVDRLVGNASSDVLAGGSSSFESDCTIGKLADETLLDFLAEDADLDDLIDSIADDGVADHLTGSSGEDLLLEGLGDVVVDGKGAGGGNGKGKNK